ncbi:MBL fold metallo-hydrolase [Paenibacillaceae bacterium]|nr:MBL fold metallo-hydrolase [Paenibacillaceae bacterium]
METEMNYGEDYAFLPVTSLQSRKGHEVLSDIYYHTIQIVNICMIGKKDDNNWVLVDAGMPSSADEIIIAAEKRFGPNSRPNGIILTHGHFDHVGAIIELINFWKVPVYAHELEMPYLTGKQSYSPPDPSVNGGLLAKLSMFYPNSPIDLGNNIEQLPSNGAIPILPGWRWIHTPGHTAGHISLFRDSDRVLIAGDAFVTVKQESIYKVFVQEKEISGPPRYFTTDWDSAKQSVINLHGLHPTIAVTGHGVPMEGNELTDSLEKLVEQFDQIAMPSSGKYD